MGKKNKNEENDVITFEQKDVYEYDEIKIMAETVTGWFAMCKDKNTRKEVEESREAVAFCLYELSQLVANDCMPIHWEGEYDEEGYEYEEFCERDTGEIGGNIN